MNDLFARLGRQDHREYLFGYISFFYFLLFSFSFFLYEYVRLPGEPIRPMYLFIDFFYVLYLFILRKHVFKGRLLSLIKKQPSSWGFL